MVVVLSHAHYSMSLSSDKQVLLTQLLAEQEAAKNAKPAAVAAREAAIAEKKKVAEEARLSAHFESVGLGDIPVAQQEDFEYFLKHMENMDGVFQEAREAHNAKLWKDHNTKQLFTRCEDSFRGLVVCAVKIIAHANLGGHKEAREKQVELLQQSSNKRQREDEKDAPHPRLGCKCGNHDSSSSVSKCGARCPCRKDNKPCSDHCRCTAENCQNPAGLPSPRAALPERRGRPVKVPVSGYMDLEPTQRFPNNRRTSESERSYQDDEVEYDYQA